MSVNPLLDKWRLVQAITADSNLTLTSRLVAIALLGIHNTKDDKCFASHEDIGRIVGITRRAAINATADLEREGWLKVTRHRGRTKSNNYEFPGLENVKWRSHFASENVNKSTEKCEPTFTPTDETTPSLREGGVEYRVASAEAARPGGRPLRTAQEADEAWSEFERLYPRKFGMKGAEREFRRIVAADEATPAQILHGLRQYLASKPKYFFSPSRWLRDGHYADELQPAEQKRQAKPKRNFPTRQTMSAEEIGKDI